MKFRFIIAFCCFISNISAQQIIIDGNTSDWNSFVSEYSDKGDYQGLDIETLQVSYDDVYLFIRIKLNREILLQQNNNILIGIDFDNNAASGFDIGTIGAELVFNFGLRNGFLSPGQGILQFQHNDVGLISSPTVSSDEFEIAIRRSFNVSGFSFIMMEEIAIHISGEEEQGDQLPNTGKFVVSLDEIRPQQNPSYSLLESAETDLRLMSYNALRDNVFQFGVRNSFQSLMKAVNADVYCFQEIVDFDDKDLLDLMIDLDILDNSQNWYSVKHQPDLVTISRFPIVYQQNLAGNSVTVLKVYDKDVLIVNMHLPCCENDFGREIEIDQVLQFIRRSKDGQTPYILEDKTPYIFCGDLNLVGESSQLESLISGDIKDNAFFGPDVTLDWDDDGMNDLIPPSTGFPAVFTWYNPSSSFYPGRLDFIIYTDSRLESLNSFVLNSQGLNQAEQATYQINDNSSLITSDHMPIVADFRIKSVDAVNDQQLQVEVYPNPTESTIIFKNLFESLESIEIFDFEGRLFKSIKNPKDRIDLDLKTGIYLLSMRSVSGKRATITVYVK